MATDAEIQKFVQHHHGFIPRLGWIVHVKEVHGIPTLRGDARSFRASQVVISSGDRSPQGGERMVHEHGRSCAIISILEGTRLWHVACTACAVQRLDGVASARGRRMRPRATAA